ncbi:large conductance mechanosensitive channel protein MscL [Methylovirgula sp. 4M-Z18]|uniref:large conductance mechanosensitive channel protein MscL n=1 Tax=Methylovirgula sp. 4M-Z18 TaxID=2293567 RepID=UPI000E2E82CF|nr:large conductance mechanosensitive channel protein MscL [Methylovirgula sp. 4M-Z18]RFB78535.1 large conductance mechanosensitive channel protein MscL [Methylovirgula sp. 4M-Z18]
MLKEFRDFAMKGNVVDLAVAVIIGAAFGAIVQSLVGDIVMPIIGAFGKADFSNYFIQLTGEHATNLTDAKKAGAVLAYGSFLTYVVNFVIIAFALFLVIKLINTLKKQDAPPPAPPAPTKTEVLLQEIRDALVNK